MNEPTRQELEEALRASWGVLYSAFDTGDWDLACKLWTLRSYMIHRLEEMEQ
jgi:hypothetical protein